MELSKGNTSTTDTSLEILTTSGQRTGAVVLAELPGLITQGIIPPLSVVSFMATVVNVVSFSKMDLSQGVTQNLLILSASDALFAAIGVFTSVLNVLARLGYLNPSSRSAAMMFSILRAAANLPLNISFLMTTIIAVVRCCSVVVPLSFRRVFTARRQLVAIAISSTSATAYMVYVSASLLTMRYSPAKNGTIIFHTKRWKDFIAKMDVFRNVLFFTCLIIILVSMIFLIVALKKSSQFQLQASSAKTSDDSKHSSKIASTVMREARVIKTIIFILAIFLACNSPFILLSITRLVLPGFSSTGNLRQWHNLIYALASMSLQLNVGLNGVVYYKYNSQYRQIIRGMFLPNRSGHKKV